MDSIFRHFSSRLSNPIYGAFLASWIAFNWKAILYVLYAERLTTVEILVIDKLYLNWVDSFVYPLLASIALLTLVPFIQWGIEKVSENITVQRKQIQIISAEKDQKLQQIRSGTREMAELKRE